MGQPAFLDLTEPVSCDHLVAGLGLGGEIPQLSVVERIGVFTSLQEHSVHRGQVVLQAVVNAGQQSGTQGDLQHPAFEFDGVSVLQAPGALEYLDGSLVPRHLYDLGEEGSAVQGDVAEFILRHRPVDLNCHQVGDNPDYFSFSLHI